MADVAECIAKLSAAGRVRSPLIARHDEGSEVAAAEAKRAERNHNENLAAARSWSVTLSLASNDATTSGGNFKAPASENNGLRF